MHSTVRLGLRLPAVAPIANPLCRFKVPSILTSRARFDMRLLKTDTIELLPQNERQPDRYAIFSHTWGKDEVIFTDLVDGEAENKSAYGKIQSACLQAAADGYSCIWIDNCCIDKRSSAELSEAINSMYVWYKQADICYAFLADVDGSIVRERQRAEFRDNLAKSKWFKRGWTLQELLAPGDITFFASDWTVIGTKLDLRGVLSSITGIDEDILEDPQKLYAASIAKRMSWAADRETTRPEDLAYCLMGIFSVNMPMLYGEGGVKAYLRLQEEIMKQSDDQSLFAWTINDVPNSDTHGLLADSPSAFRNCRKIMPYEDYSPRRPFQMTNRGLSIEIPLSRLNDDTWVAALDCPVPPAYPNSSFLAVYLQKLSADSDQYARTRIGRLTQVTELGAVQMIYVRQVLHNPADDQRPFPNHIFQLRNIPSIEEYQIVNMLISPDEDSKTPPPPLTTSRISGQQKLLINPSTFSIARGAQQLTVAIILKHISDGDHLVLMLGSSVDFRVGYDAVAWSDLNVNSQNVFGSFSSRFHALDPDSCREIELENHHVRVGIDSVISGASKYYMVDIGVVAKHRKPGFFDSLVDTTLEEDLGYQARQVKRSIWEKITIQTKTL
jgi:hypothetical protein